MSTEHRHDVCRCGDFRRNHANGRGRCMIHGCHCGGFSLHMDAAEYARTHPEHQATLDQLGL